MEGFILLFVCVMVFWFGVWMYDCCYVVVWQDYICSSLVGGGGCFGFVVLVFFLVYCELFEVILFYEIFWLQVGLVGYNVVIGGVVIVVVLLIGLVWVILCGLVKLLLGLFFSINVVLFCVFLVVFVGYGVIVLQEVGVIGICLVLFFDFDWLGIKVDVYLLLVQVMVLVVIVLFYGCSWIVECWCVVVNVVD